VGERVGEAGTVRESQGAHDEHQRHARTGAPSAVVVSDGGLGTEGPQDGRRGRKYRARIVIYWIATLLVAQENVAGSIWAYLRLEFITANLKHLGYPPYFLNIIGFWQLPCAIAIIVPRFGLVKEWAYAGAFFNYSSAVYSHVVVGDDPNKWMAPLVFAVLTTMSLVLRPPERRLVPIIHPQPTRARDWVIPVVVLFLLAAISLLTLPKGPDGW
jgi:hypothetical protein